MSDIEEISNLKFCALEYRPQSIVSIAPSPSIVILLVLLDSQGEIRFLVHPELRNIVLRDDLEYLDSLLWDLVDRSKRFPEELFRQISSLAGLGPLATHQTGSRIADFPSLMELMNYFAEL